MVAPFSSCQTAGCRERNKPLQLQRNGYAGHLFTCRRGVLPVRILTLYCRVGCQTTYRPNYSVQHAEQSTATRLYYPNLPDQLEATEHGFVEKDLLVMIRMQMAFAQASGDTIARMYNLGVSQDPDRQELTADIVWNAFYLHALLMHHSRLGLQLNVPHRTKQAERFTQALVSRNEYMVGTRQPHWAHACDDCEKIYPPSAHGADWTRVSAVVMDGICIGHPRCAVPLCTTPLASPRDRFCPGHRTRDNVCGVEGCLRPITDGMRTCDLKEHRQYELDKRAKGQALHKLRRRLEKHKFPQSETRHRKRRRKAKISKDPPPLKASITRKWTHNEQLLVRPCGVIISRATFYESEGVGNVHSFLEACFPPYFPRSLPSFIFYDNNCNLLEHLHAIGEKRFTSIGMVVDVFHAVTKHKESDGFCARHCNPAAFPELLDANGDWLFNSSACEQVNVRFGDFGPIVREMTEFHHNFFLDKMIMILNDYRVSVLAKRGKNPRSIPVEELRLPR
ncbi:hypothetical protein C8Q76DRAFT_621583 [Earliella scabrosa]|nr:hypothetical protein C8Q76DRAFT_621583 [Earliella scabrosa]